MRGMVRSMSERCLKRILSTMIGLIVAVQPVIGAPPTPLKGPVLLLFNDPLGGLPEKQSGIFRAEEPPDYQYIEEKVMEIPLPGKDNKAGMALLLYNVSGAGSYNGYWLKCGDVDWTPYANNGELVLVLRRMDPKADPFPRSVKLSGGNTQCASNFKVELKVKTSDDRIASVGLRVNVTNQMIAQQKVNGTFEVRIPLSDFGLDLKQVHEFVIVFENNRLLPNEQRGALGIRGLFVTPEKNQQVDEFTSGMYSILEELGEQGVRWFDKVRHPVSGMVLDRAPHQESFRPDPEKPAMASIAAVGYDLSLTAARLSRGRVTRQEAEGRAGRTLRFLLDRVDHHDGVMAHFCSWESGKKWGKSEYSILDTAICLNGCIVIGQALGGDVLELANQLLDRVRWDKYLITDKATGKQYLSLGWSGETNSLLLARADVRSSEMAMAYFLAIGSKTHPIPAQTWYNTSINYSTVLDYKFLNRNHPLFTSYFGLGWHHLKDADGKSLVDRDQVDLETNARNAALANRAFCRVEATAFPTYADENGFFWGISAGDAPGGRYIAPGLEKGDAEGIVWPMCALPALTAIPDIFKEDLPRWRASKVWARVATPYGIAPFRLGEGKNWVAPDLISIDLGSFAVALANHRNQAVWKLWHQHPVAQNAIERIGFRSR